MKYTVCLDGDSQVIADFIGTLPDSLSVVSFLDRDLNALFSLVRKLLHEQQGGFISSDVFIEKLGTLLIGSLESGE